MPDDDEIIVTIDPALDMDTSIEGADKTKTQERPDEPIADLKAQFATLQTTAATATQRATSAESEAQRATRERDEERQRREALETEVADTRKATVESGLSAAEGQLKSAKEAYKRAFADGDADAAADAQVQIAEATSTIGRLKEAKADLVDTKPPPRKTDTPPPRTQADPIEAFIASRTPKTQEWLRNNREWLDGGKKNSRLTAAHYDAEAEGIAPDTAEYFAHVEKYLGIKPKGDQPLARRPSAPAAPGADAGGRSATPMQVTLKPHEKTAATDGTIVWNFDDPSGKGRFKKGDPIGVQEFARRKLIMEKEGRYDRSFVES